MEFYRAARPVIESNHPKQEVSSMNEQINMGVGKFGRVIAARLQPGMDVMEGLRQICEEQGLNNGVVICGQGSLNGVRFLNPLERADRASGYGYGDPLELRGPIELVSTSGLISHKEDGSTDLHIHVNLSDRYGNAYGGHLIGGTKVLITVSFVIAEIEDMEMKLSFDPALGFPAFCPTTL